MAITGSGTEQDPFIVHSYSEMKSACAGQPSSSYLKMYVELANDVNCNDYGENFEWETIRGKSNTYAFSLDLKGHAIKNFKVKEGHRVFSLDAQYGGKTEIKNGKILNAYLTGSEGFCIRNGNVENTLLENLSMSINVAGGLRQASNKYMFEEVPINACAIYVEGKMWDGNYNAVFNAYNASYPISNCDILVHFPQAVTGSSTLVYGMTSNAKSVVNCRIRGVFNTGFGLLYCGCKNCVIDLLNESTGLVSQTVQDNTGIINSDKYISVPTYAYSGMTAVTSQEIINGDALRAKGFDVINVVA